MLEVNPDQIIWCGKTIKSIVVLDKRYLWEGDYIKIGLVRLYRVKKYSVPIYKADMFMLQNMYVINKKTEFKLINLSIQKSLLSLTTLYARKAIDEIASG